MPSSVPGRTSVLPYLQSSEFSTSPPFPETQPPPWRSPQISTKKAIFRTGRSQGLCTEQNANSCYLLLNWRTASSSKKKKKKKERGLSSSPDLIPPPRAAGRQTLYIFLFSALAPSLPHTYFPASLTVTSASVCQLHPQVRVVLVALPGSAIRPAALRLRASSLASQQETRPEGAPRPPCPAARTTGGRLLL